MSPMTALPHPGVCVEIAGQTDARDTSGRQDARTPGPQLHRTPAGTPIFVFNGEPWATTWRVSVRHAGEVRHSWVRGDPARLVELAHRICVVVEVHQCIEIDPTLPPVEVLEC